MEFDNKLKKIQDKEFANEKIKNNVEQIKYLFDL